MPTFQLLTKLPYCAILSLISGFAPAPERTAGFSFRGQVVPLSGPRASADVLTQWERAAANAPLTTRSTHLKAQAKHG